MMALPVTPSVYGATPPDVVSVSYGACEVDWASNTPLVTMIDRMTSLAVTTGMSFFVSSATPVPPAASRTRSWRFSTLRIAVGDCRGRHRLDAEPGQYDRGRGRLERHSVRAAVRPGRTVVVAAARAGSSRVRSGSRETGASGRHAAHPGRVDVRGLPARRGNEPRCCRRHQRRQSDGGRDLGPDDPLARASGRSVPGFAAPLLYALGRSSSPALRDVTAANNDILNAGCCDATPAWDLATGWGSLRGQELAQALYAPGPPTNLTSVSGYASAVINFTRQHRPCRSPASSTRSTAVPPGTDDAAGSGSVSVQGLPNGWRSGAAASHDGAGVPGVPVTRWLFRRRRVRCSRRSIRWWCTTRATVRRTVVQRPESGSESRCYWSGAARLGRGGVQPHGHQHGRLRPPQRDAGRFRDGHQRHQLVRPGQIIANAARSVAGNRITVADQGGATDFLVSVVGYYAPVSVTPPRRCSPDGAGAPTTPATATGRSRPASSAPSTSPPADWCRRPRPRWR